MKNTTMKNIYQYIEELLYHHQCVIIPELGAFIANRVSATFNENRTISPPSKVISFNSRLISNDGLLINYIAKKESISYEDSQALVSKFVEKCKVNLKTGKQIEFQNVGILHEIGNNRINFSPFQHNFLTDSFGMTTIIAQEAKLNQEEKQVLMSRETFNLENKNNALTYKKDNTLEYLKYAAIIVLGITALSYGFFISMANYSKNTENNMLVDLQSIQKEVENHISEATFLSAAPLELPSLKLNVVRIPEEKEKIENKTLATSDNNNSKEKTTNNNASEFKYHVIAGAFSSEENANTRVEQLKEMGFQSTVIGKSRSGLYQVVYQSFKTKDEAETFNKTIKKNQQLDSWILKTN